MPTEVYEDTRQYTIEWDEELDAVVHTWNEFTTGEDFRDGCERLLDVIKERNARKLLVDTSAVQAHSDEDQRWLQEEWTPRTFEVGLKYSAMVHQDSVIAEMDLEKMMDRMEDAPQEPMLTSDVAEAREWLASK